MENNIAPEKNSQKSDNNQTKSIFPQNIDFKKILNWRPKIKTAKGPIAPLAMMIVLVAIIAGATGAVLTNFYWEKHVATLYGISDSPILKRDALNQNGYIPQTTEEEKVIKAVKDNSSAVVSVIITKDVPILEQYFINPFGFDWPFGSDFQIPQYRQKGTEKQEVGGGTGFIISEDGMVLTNKHVILDTEAEYTVLMNDGQKYPAKILAKDPFYDLAILKIDQSTTKETERKTFHTVKLGDSTNLQIGQSVIAIGNALGEFQNTVSTGVISGLGRNISASGTGFTESLEGIIQTDAAINPGNSGGPLLNLAGEVIGINVARSTSGENIGFSLPINTAKRDIDQIKATGEIVYPFLGVYYTLITDELSKANNLPVNYGAWVGRDGTGQKTDEFVFSGSPAAVAGIQRDDIILEFGAKKIDSQNSLAKLILTYKPGDQVSLKILRGGKEITLNVTLTKRTE